MGRTLARAHTSQPWEIHAYAPDFRLEDVWSLPMSGGPNDFETALDVLESLDLDNGGSSRVSRLLFAVRWKLGELFGWDHAAGAGEEAPKSALRERLPADLRATAARRPEPAGSPFTTLYRLDREYAAEIVNKTVTGVLHLGWVANGHGGYRAQMAVLVKPNGAFGQLYMALIKPFRYAIVYPAMLRAIERAWRQRQSAVPGTPAFVAL